MSTPASKLHDDDGNDAGWYNHNDSDNDYEYGAEERKLQEGNGGAEGEHRHGQPVIEFFDKRKGHSFI